ncbi:efflux RND transporter permease subunit [Lysinibacillus telephonicus]|uniref:Efflux RND transporter permease subunit n=1 Tax=Lysinibacillus telephonicus TaxID=1714840 RepID=A0A3S0QYG6_9BACI|nr:efflux RND transporter permease subunit [Lysinibacillus telephonicus]RTQ96597.1 efflux RND transporter permease subunit [Lysinibacillus telephonicus]
MKLIKTSIKRPVGVIMFVVVAIVLGFISLAGLKVDLFPKMDLPIAVVATSYTGASPQEIEELITKPIESSVGTIEGLDTLQSTSQQGASLVIMMFDFGRDIDDALIDVREKIDQIGGMLPEAANDPMVMRLDPNAMPVVYASLTGAELSELQDIAENEVQPAIERAGGVASASIVGGIEREIQVNLDSAMLTNYGVTGSQIISALQAENKSISAGTVERGGKDVQLRVVGEYTSVDDIRNTNIPLPDGTTIKVSDVAEVVDTFKEQSSISTVNGEETLMFSIMKQSDANTVEVAEDVQKVMADLNEKFEERGLKLTTIMDTSTYISDSMDSVVQNMIIGGGLAAIILLFFLRSLKATLVIGITMPIAVISTFTLMYFTGETLNTISMGGLALGIGMMVDSSIVILENIFKKRQEGLPVLDAAAEGASELVSAVIASTLTTAVVFLPVVFVEGIASQIFRPLSLAVVFSLTASLVCAITLIPMLSSKMLGNVKIAMDNEEPKDLFNKMLNKFKNFYGKVLKKALHRRKTVISIVIAAFIGSFALLPVVGMEMMPVSDSGQVTITATLQNGSQLEETKAVVDEINERLANYEDIMDVNAVSIGGSTDGVSAGSANTASYMIQLVKSSEREITTKEFVAEVSELVSDIPGAEITVIDSNQGMSTGSPIQIQIKGDNLDVLKDLSQQVVWIMEDIEGTLNVESSFSDGNPEIQVIVNRELAAEYGLSYQQIMSEISLAFYGQVATQYKEDGTEYDVNVSFSDESTTTVRDLETMMIRNAEGINIPLTAVAELVQVQGPSQINRQDQIRGVNVTSDIIGKDLGTVTQEINAQLAQISLPDGYEISTGGQSEQMMESFGQLGLALVLGIFLVYMVMAVQFESFVTPFVIMFSMPTMLIGVILGLFIMNVSLSLPGFIGLIMLAGIVVNNGILLVEYINILREKGMERMEAIVEAGKSRLRPILMTTATTVLAMIPLALAIGEGAESQQPMAVVVVFGLTVSTMFTLVFVPVMYVTIENINNKFKGLFKRNKKDNQDNSDRPTKLGKPNRKWPFKRNKEKVEPTPEVETP